MDAVVLLAGVMLLALTLYVLTGGADFGGGVWDLFASGPRARAQRELVAHAIGPIWEANHVWIILVVVLLFVGFPQAFAAISTALNIPLTLLLFGIVLRGSTFAFRAYDRDSPEVYRRWSILFATSSTITPIMLGMAVGAVSSGRIRIDAETGRVFPDFFGSWLAPLPFAIGGLTLAICAFLAAVYLTLEAQDPALQDDFRARALGSAVAVGALAWGCFLLAGEGAPILRQGLSARGWSMPFQLVLAGVALGTMAALWWRRFALARILAMGQVTLMLWGWAASQYPFLVAPDLTFARTAAPESVLKPVLWALAAGSLLLVPAFVWLYALFKRPDASGPHAA